MPLGEELENTEAELIKVNGHPPSVPVINSAATNSAAINGAGEQGLDQGRVAQPARASGTRTRRRSPSISANSVSIAIADAS